MSSNDPQNTPSWPSLYNPGLEILNIQHNDPVQPGAHYLYRPHDVFRFTLYWTLIFYVPLFLLCGCYAFWNYAFPPSMHSFSKTTHGAGGKHYRARYHHKSIGHLSSTPVPESIDLAPVRGPKKPVKVNERRSRVTFALIVLFTFITLSLAGAVIGSAILGFVTAGLYHVARFHMSTWIPFLLSVMQVVIGLLSVWPAIIEII